MHFKSSTYASPRASASEPGTPGLLLNGFDEIFESAAEPLVDEPLAPALPVEGVLEQGWSDFPSLNP
jgi:hypothetical protein